MLIGKKKNILSARMKNVAKITSGTMAGQIISFITLPIIARIYGAEVMGEWTLLNSIAVVVNSFSDFGLTNAIMIEDDESSSLRIYNVLSTIVLVFAFIAGVIMLLYYYIWPNDLGINEVFMGAMMAILIFTLQQTQLCYTWLNRQGKYGILMKNPMINGVTIGIVAIGLGLSGVKIYGYYIATILGQMITLIHMKRFLPRKMFTLKLTDYQYVFNKRLDFIKYQLPTNIISQIKNQLPVLLIESFFGTKILGYYSISVKILNIPITMLAKALGRVFFQTISDMKRRGEEIGEFAYRNIVKAMKISIVPMIFLVAIGDMFVTMLYGEGYEMSGLMLQIVSFQNFFTFLMMSSQGITITLNKQKYAMISCVVQALGYIIGLAGGAFVFNDIYIGLVLMSIIYVLVQIVYFCSLFKVMNISWEKYIFNVISSMLIIIVGAGVLRTLVICSLDFLKINI